MLQTLREHAQGWIAGVIVAILCLAFALWGIQYYLEGDSDTNTVAKVNGEPIAQSTFDNAYQRLRDQQLQVGSNVTLTPAEQQALKNRVLDQLIDQQVLAQIAIKTGYRINLAQIETVITQIPAFQSNGQFSSTLFANTLAALSYSQAEFLQNLQHSMLISQVQTSFTDSAFVLPNEVNDAIRLSNQKRDLAYLVVPASRFLAKTKIDDAAIQTYYLAHQKDFMQPERVSLQYLALSAPQISAKVQVTGQDAANYYQNNLAQFTSPMQWQIARILVKLPANADSKTVQAAQRHIEQLAQQAQHGTDFSVLAKQYSQDQSTAATGGMLNWFDRRGQSPVLVQIASSLQVGQISAPFRTEQGFSIIKLLGVKQAYAKPFAAVSQQIMQTLRQQKIQQVFTDASDKLTNLTYTNSNTLAAAAKALNLPIESTSLFSHQGGQSGLAANPKIIAAAFADNVLQGNNSDPIQVDDNTLVVIRVKHYQPATTKPLTAVHQQIQQQLQIASAQQQAQALGQTLILALQQGKKPALLAKKYNLVWQNYNTASRHQPGVDAQILRAAFDLPRDATQQKPAITGTGLATGDYAIVSVSAVYDADIKKINPQQYEVEKNTLIGNFGQLDYELYIDDALRKASIKKEINK